MILLIEREKGKIKKAQLKVVKLKKAIQEIGFQIEETTEGEIIVEE